jgi:hypothetical protein
MYKWPFLPGTSAYQVVRSRFVTFTAGCQTFDVSGTLSLTDATNPLPGTVAFYLVRAKTPNAGSWGKDSAGAERVVPCVP